MWFVLVFVLFRCSVIWSLQVSSLKIIEIFGRISEHLCWCLHPTKALIVSGSRPRTHKVCVTNWQFHIHFHKVILLGLFWNCAIQKIIIVCPKATAQAHVNTHFVFLGIDLHWLQQIASRVLSAPLLATIGVVVIKFWDKSHLYSISKTS